MKRRTYPITFNSDKTIPPPVGCFLVDEKGKEIGKLLNSDGKHGIALCFSKDIDQKAYVQKTPVLIDRPFWWPPENKWLEIPKKPLLEYGSLMKVKSITPPEYSYAKLKELFLV